MAWNSIDTPNILIGFAGSGLLTVLAFCAWRRRAVPGALPFFAFVLCGALWVLATTFQLLARELNAVFFWQRFAALWLIPAITAAACFALEYANLGRWLSRLTFALLAMSPVAFAFLTATNDFHHWIWSGVSYVGHVHLQMALGTQIFQVYGFVLSLVTPVVFIWLFVYSPLHRWPAGLCISTTVLSRIFYVQGVRSGDQVWSAKTAVLVSILTAITYALALFRFRLFDLIPVAQGTVTEQMHEGMLILDCHNRLIDLNPAAATIIGTPVASARGCDIGQFLPVSAGPNWNSECISTDGAEVHLD